MSNEVHLPADAQIVSLTLDEVKAFNVSVREELRAYLDAGLLTRPQVAFERSYLSNIGVYDFWGCRWWGAVHGGQLAAIHAAKFSTTRRKNAWGRYINVYLAFTRISRRQEGFGSALELHIEDEARADGYDRIKTTCQSWLGFGYHERCRHQFWGINDKGELILDTPLHDGKFPPGVPIEGRKWNTTGEELADDDLLAILTDPKGRFHRAEAEVVPILAKRAWRRAEPRPARVVEVPGIEPGDAAPVVDGTPSTGNVAR